MGIVALLAGLLGMILAFEAAAQLTPLGARLYVPDLVGISLVREFGPLLVGIVIIGRSGAAVAAELASMRAGEEVDALRTMGIDPIGFLIVPRFLGLLVIQPLLTLLANFVGLLGGIVVGVAAAHLDPLVFYQRLVTAVGFHDVLFGLIKSGAFACAIALAASAVGLRESGSAAEVGKSTTRAVVLGIFLLVVVDSIFSLYAGATGV